jgi:hypothetical protein
MADVTSKQQTTALFLSTSHTHKKTRRTDKKNLTNLMGNLCCAENVQFSFSCNFFTQLNCTVFNFKVYGSLNEVFYRLLLTVSGCQSAPTHFPSREPCNDLESPRVGRVSTS